MKEPKTVSLALFIGALALFTSFTLSGCDEADKTYTVKYEITGPSIIADRVMYNDQTNQYFIISDVSIPWEKTFTVTGKLRLICGMTYNHSTGDTYTATIYVDGSLFKTASSSTGVVSCSGTSQ